jgi:hypothetical protein
LPTGRRFIGLSLFGRVSWGPLKTPVAFPTRLTTPITAAAKAEKMIAWPCVVAAEFQPPGHQNARQARHPCGLDEGRPDHPIHVDAGGARRILNAPDGAKRGQSGGI